MRSLGVAILAAAFLLALSACRSDSAHHRALAPGAASSAAAAPSTLVRPAVEAWRDDAGTPISPIVAAGDGVGVVYIRRHGAIAVVAIDLADGRELWTKRAPDNLDDAAMPFATGRLIAVALVAGPTSYAAGLDPRTGREVWSSPHWKQMSDFWWNGADHSALTVTGDGATWLAPTKAISAGRSHRGEPFEVYTDLLNGVGFADESDQAIRRVRHAKVAWVATNAELRPGWHVVSGLNHVQHGRVVINMVEDDAAARVRPHQMAVVVLDARDGHVVWSRRATELCALIEPRDKPSGEQVPRYETFCEYHGGTLENIMRPGGHAAVGTTDLLGVDIVTGREIWRRPYGHAIGTGPASTESGEQAYLSSSRGEELIDMRTGTSHAVPADFVAWQVHDFAGESHDSYEPLLARERPSAFLKPEAALEADGASE